MCEKKDVHMATTNFYFFLIFFLNKMSNFLYSIIRRKLFKMCDVVYLPYRQKFNYLRFLVVVCFMGGSRHAHYFTP